jgi:hypothetical protein
MLTYFLFFFYLFTGTALLHIIIRRKIFPFRIYHTSSLIIFKILMGCLYGWVFLHYYGGDDTWNYFIESKAETGILLRHPFQFIHEFLPQTSLKASDQNVFKALGFYIEHFERWFFVKGLAVLNLLSGKNYYIDVLLFEFLTIAGPLLLFKILANEFPLRTGVNFILIFFIPSIVFWCSGIRAEALLLMFMALAIFNGNAYTRKPGLKSFLGILGGLTGLLLIRYQFLLVFLPAFVAYFISLKKTKNAFPYFRNIYLILGLVFIASLFFPPAYQLSKPISHSQESFFLLKGNTRYHLDTLETGPKSFLEILPQALANSTFRPYPWEGKSLLQSLSSIDVLFLVAGLVYFLSSPEKRNQVNHPLYWLFIYYSISQLVTIGYAVPFPGAIVRYRSISFLMVSLFLYSGNPLLQQKIRSWIFK